MTETHLIMTDKIEQSKVEFSIANPEKKNFH